MSDIDPTPSTPVTIKDYMTWWRSDINARLSSLETKLDGLITQLTTGGGIDSAPIVAAIETLGDGKTLLDVHTLLSAINSAIGGAPHSSLELGTVRGFLSAIANNTGKYGILPDGTQGSASSGSTTVNGRRFIYWVDITNVTESADGLYLTPSGDWTGYYIYIQTDAPSAILHDNTSPAQNIDPYTVNSWTEIGGDHELGWSVEASYQVRGYLRAPVAPIAILIEEVTRPGATLYQVDWSKYDYGSSTDTGSGITYSKPIFLLRDPDGFTLTAASTNAGDITAIVSISVVNGNPQSSFTIAPGASVVITQTGVALNVGGTLGDEFTLTTLA